MFLGLGRTTGQAPQPVTVSYRERLAPMWFPRPLLLQAQLVQCRTVPVPEDLLLGYAQTPQQAVEINDAISLPASSQFVVAAEPPLLRVWNHPGANHVHVNVEHAPA